MSTIQQLISNGIQAAIAADPDLSPLVKGEDGPDNNSGVILTPTTATNFTKVEINSGMTTITGSFLPVITPVGYQHSQLIKIPHTALPGEIIAIDVRVGLNPAKVVIFRIPTSVTPDKGGYDWINNIVIPGVPAVTTPTVTTPTVASDRRLVVMEVHPTLPDKGKLYAIPPNSATGIALPTMQIGNVLPVAGTTVGETFYNSTTGTASVWNGTSWRPIVYSPVREYLTEAQMRADTAAVAGTYGLVTTDGIMYLRTANGWRRIGIYQVPSLAQLPTNALPGDEAVTVDTGVQYVRMQGTPDYWRPTTFMTDTETNIRLNTRELEGQKAISSDTGRTFIRVMIGGNLKWVEEPINHFDKEIMLLAANSPDGTLAWADDTGAVFTRVNSTWRRLPGPHTYVGAVQPVNPAEADLWHNGVDSIKIWSTAENKWLEASGSAKYKIAYINDPNILKPILLGRGDWNTAEITGMIETRDLDCHVLISALDDNDQPMLTKAFADTIDSRVWYSYKHAGFFSEVNINPKIQVDQFFNGDKMAVTWLANAGTNANDSISKDATHYSTFKMVITQTYDPFVHVAMEINYVTELLEQYCVKSQVVFSKKLGGITRLKLEPIYGLARIGFAGSVLLS